MADETTMLVSSGDGFMEDDDWDKTLAEINLNISPDDLKPKPPTSERTYTYKNVPIKFPYRAYKSQHQMMQKIIEGVTTGENCLLESPTGTGKTAALLCSLLGWQRYCYNKNDNCKSIIEAAVAKMGGCTCGFTRSNNTKVIFKREYGKLYLHASTVDETPTTPGTPGSSSKGTPHSQNTTPVNSPFKQPPSSPRNGSPMVLDFSSPTKPNKRQASNFSPMKSPAKPQLQPSSSTSAYPVTPVKMDSLPASTNFESPTKKLKGDPTTEESPLLPQSPNQSPRGYEERSELNQVCAYCARKYLIDTSRPPRIYYATRTHSQIQQVVKQLKKHYLQ